METMVKNCFKLPSAYNKSFEGITETLRTLVDALQTDSRNNNPKFSYSKNT